MFGLGTFELVIIFAVIILLFGPKRLPDLASGIAKSIKAFRREIGGEKVKGMKGIEDDQQ